MTAGPIGVLHPGAMGAALGGLLAATGRDVVWSGHGRSPASRQRAADEGLRDLGALDELTEVCAAIVSVCPPAAAQQVASAVAAAGFTGLYVDANAVAPATARRIADTVEAAGASFVDGGIVGGPPRTPGTTRLYLAGPGAAEVAHWFEGTPLGTVILAGPVGAASALKAAYAGWTKGSAALLLAVRAFARAEGVEDALLDEWASSVPDALERSGRVAATIHRKAWRFAGELREIGDALDDAGLPAGFHHAAADLYARLTDLKDVAADQDPGPLLDRIVADRIIAADPGP